MARVLPLARKLESGLFPVALEITPPRRERIDILRRRASLLGKHADAINVIDRPDRLSSLDASLALGANGLDPVWHLVSRGRTRGEVRAEIARAAAGGIGAALCIRGDHDAPDVPDTPRVRDTVEMIRDAIPDALIGVTMNPYVDRSRVLRNLIPKLRSGATFVQTQPVFSLETLRPLAEEVKSRAPEAKVVPMVMPLDTEAAARRFRERLGIAVPEALLTRLESGGTSAAWAAFSETVEALRTSPLVAGIAVMTLDMDPDRAFARRLVSVLDEVLPGT